MADKQVRQDGWANILTGLGTKADKSKSTVAIPNGMLLDYDLETIYADDGIGAKIVDLIVEDMFKQGWELKFENENDKQYKKEYWELFKNVNLVGNLIHGFKWCRLYGGGLILLGMFDGKGLDQPLNVKMIRWWENMRIIPRCNIPFDFQWYVDPRNKNYGNVERYPVNFFIGNQFQTVNVHSSRVIPLYGIKVPYCDESFIPAEYRYWGFSVLQRIVDSLKNTGSAFSSLAQLLQEVSVGKYKFKELAQIVSSKDGVNVLQRRIQAMDVMKSAFHSIVMDNEEDFVRDNVSFSGIADILYQFFMIICASSGYPMTKLFGISPGGLNSTGESDTYNYYDAVQSKQEQELRPVLERIVSIVSEWKGIPKPEIKFNPIEQMSSKEEAEIEEKKANAKRAKMETYRGYYDMGILNEEDIRKMEFGDLEKITTKPVLPPVETK